MNSWDCFDTLIARRFVHPYSVFDEVGKRLNIANFRELRISAERNGGTSYEKIYKNLPGVDPSVELAVEHEHCFPIVENLEKVGDGDLIVSDMYLDKDVILSLLRNCGLQKNVTVEVSYGGKHTGEVWKRFGQENIGINVHHGDNHHADINQARSHGFNVCLLEQHKMTRYEEEIAKHNFELACFIRYMRLQFSYNLFKSKKIDLKDALDFWSTQANWNIPILILFCKYLEDEPGELGFLYRDCHFLHELYEQITGRKSTGINCSRMAIESACPFFNSYFTEICKNKTLVELHASGRSLRKILTQNKLITLTRCGPEDKKTNIFLPVIESCEDTIEKTNPFGLGALAGMSKEGKFVRIPCEHSGDDLFIMECVKKTALAACKLFNIPRKDSLIAQIHDRKVLSGFPIIKPAKIHVANHVLCSSEKYSYTDK